MYGQSYTLNVNKEQLYAYLGSFPLMISSRLGTVIDFLNQLRLSVRMGCGRVDFFVDFFPLPYTIYVKFLERMWKDAVET